MSIKSKIALSIIGTGVCIFFIVFFFLEKNQNEKINNLREETIFSLNTQISKIIEKHEKTIELHLHSSINAIIAEVKKNKENLNNNRLRALADKFDISEVYIMNTQGSLAYSSNYGQLEKAGIAKTFNFFAMCPDEKDIIGTDNVYKKTPMFWLSMVQEPTKFYWTYDKELDYIVEVTYIFKDLNQILGDIKQSFDDVLEISLLSPSNSIISTSIPESEQIERNKTTSVINYETVKINIDGKEHFFKSFGQKYSNICGIPDNEYFYTMHLVLKNTQDYIFSKRKITDYIIFIPLMILVLFLLIYGLKLLDGVTELNRKMRLYMTENGKKIRVENQSDGDEIKQMHDIFNVLKSFIADLLINEKKLSKYQAIGQTTQFLAHDLRKPFSQLQIILRMMRTSSGNINFDKYIPAIETSAHKVNTLLSDIMEFGSNKEVKKEPCSVKHLVHHALESEVGQNSSKNIKLEYQWGHENKILGDFDKLSRVFLNLLHNAVEEVSDGDKIVVSTKMHNGKVLVSILNTGSFIPKEKIENLFEPFITHKAGGTGLGLAISKEIVEAHGGSINCQSSHAEGTKFSFDLIEGEDKDDYTAKMPSNINQINLFSSTVESRESVKLDNALEETVISGLQKSKNSLKICLIDDDNIYSDAIEKMLETLKATSEKIQFLTISKVNSIDDIKIASGYDLLIVDMDLGSTITGADVVRYLKSKVDPPYICIHTDHISKKYLEKYANLGSDLVTPKPMSYHNLLKIISACI